MCHRTQAYCGTDVNGKTFVKVCARYRLERVQAQPAVWRDVVTDLVVSRRIDTVLTLVSKEAVDDRIISVRLSVGNFLPQ